MARVLIQAPFEQRHREIQACLRPLHIGTIKSNDKNASTAFIKYESPLMFIADSYNISTALVGFVDQLRDTMKFDRPIILILDETKEAFQIMKSKRNVHVVEREKIYTQLPPLIEKLLQKPNLTKQQEQRYVTNTALNVECVEDGRDLQSVMTNLSSSGAMVEFPADPQLSKGALLKLHVQLQEVNSSHNMHAEVVWTKMDPKSGRMGCGVRFINEQKMYEALMSRI
mgnify:CR=1 FL=1|tara:strand:+ start:488 stop:1168 length:681 start_codon:yes stop_codon:yes gene_type:complete